MVRRGQLCEGQLRRRVLEPALVKCQLQAEPTLKGLCQVLIDELLARPDEGPPPEELLSSLTCRWDESVKARYLARWVPTDEDVTMAQAYFRLQALPGVLYRQLQHELAAGQLQRAN